MTAPDQPPDRPGLGLSEAAAQLGISREAVRSRVRRGQLPGEQTARGWVVWLPGPDQGLTSPETSTPPVQTTPDRPADQPDATGELAQLRARVLALEADKGWLQTQLEHAAVERAELRRLLAASLPGLPAPVDTVTTAPTMDATPPAPASSTGDTPRSLWRRFWKR
jgi:hypothetical protein